MQLLLASLGMPPWRMLAYDPCLKVQWQEQSRGVATDLVAFHVLTFSLS